MVPPAEHVPTTSTTVVNGHSPTPTMTNQDQGEAAVEGEVASRREPPRRVVDGRLSYQSSYGFASRQIHRHSQGTLLPSSGEPKVSNLWNNVQRKDSI
jgi:hypothetical protein